MVEGIGPLLVLHGLRHGGMVMNIVYGAETKELVLQNP